LEKKELIDLVDRECKKKSFTPCRIISIVVQIAFSLIVIILLIYLLWLIRDTVLMYALELPEDARIGYLVGQLLTFGAISIAIIGIIVSFSLNLKLNKSTIDELVDWYYKKLLKVHCYIEAKDRPILKALIKMKYAEFDFSLSEICQRNPLLFEDEVLLKNLYKS